MVYRRIGSYFIDLTIFIGLIVLSYVVCINLFSPSNLFLEIIIVFPAALLLLFIEFGVINYFLKGSIGKKFLDLKVTPTNGWLTPVRIFVRDIIGKYIVFTPFAIGLYKWLDRPQEKLKLFRIDITITLVMVVLLIVVNVVSYVMHKKVFVDDFFDTYVENDIPTAVEYSDIIKFKEENKTTKW